MGMVKKIGDFLDVRLGIRDILEQNLTRYLLPRNINTWYTLGAVLLTLFAVQFASGILLLIYYNPTTDEAFRSVQRIMNEVPFGWLIRTVHAVGANIIIMALLLHMLSVLFMGSYKRPRELTWVAGFLILLLPFLDRSLERRPARRPFFVTAYLLGLALFVTLSVWGHFS